MGIRARVARPASRDESTESRRSVRASGGREETVVREGHQGGERGDVRLQREDHTLGNVLRMELHKNPDVVFAGYKNPHPTDHRIVLKVHTNANTTPVQALRDAVTNLRAEVSDVAQQFSDEINAIRRE